MSKKNNLDELSVEQLEVVAGGFEPLNGPPTPTQPPRNDDELRRIISQLTGETPL